MISRSTSVSSLHRLAFALASILLIALAWQAARVQQALLDANHEVTSGLELITVLQDIQVSLLDIETGERGYVITGSPEYLRPYRQARARLDEELSDLDTLLQEQAVADSSVWRQRLTPLIERRLSIAETNVQVRETDGLEAAALRLLVAGGRQVMDQLRDVLGEREATERSRLVQDSLSASRQAERARWLAVIGGLLVACLFAAAYVSIHRMLRIRWELLEDAEHREARLDALLQAVPDALFILDGAGYLSRLGRSGAITESFAQELERRLAEQDGSPRRHGFVWKEPGPADAPREFEVRLVPTRDGEHLAMARDITERRQIERIKSEFVSTVSHELRTPLTAIRGALRMVSGGVAGPVPESLKPLVDIADKNSERLVTLINDILDIEKLEAGRLVFHSRPVALRPLVEQALIDNAPYADSFGVGLTLEAPAVTGDVELDPDRFAQIMANLLSNASKHSPPGGEVKVGIQRLVDGEGHWLAVSVSDSGAGIPLAFQPHVFERFAQADGSDRRRTGGTGLGLAITRNLVEAMGGRIDFTSTPGQGTRFQVAFPCHGTAVNHHREPT